MTVTLTGPIVLENPRSIGGSSRSLELDGQLWLSPGRNNNSLKGVFRYFNSDNITFDGIGYYMAWIHMARFVPILTPNQSSVESETEIDECHVVGDIFRLIPTTEEYIFYPPHVSVAGPVSNIDDKNNIFDCDAPQYTSFFKTRKELSSLPIRAHFDDNRYKHFVPLPGNNSYVAVDGFLTQVDLDTVTELPSRFHVNVETIGFLGKVPGLTRGYTNQPSPSTTSTPGSSSSRRYSFCFPTAASPTPSTNTDAPTPTSPHTPKRQSKRKRVS